MKNKNTFISTVLASICTILLIYVNTAGRTTLPVSAGSKDIVEAPVIAKIEYEKMPTAVEAEKLCVFFKENNIKAQIIAKEGVDTDDIEAVGIFTSYGHKIITSIHE